jgi:putative redox protein
MNEKITNRVINILYTFSAIAVLLGAFFKLQHYPHGNQLVWTGIIVGTIVSVFDTLRLKKIIKTLEERTSEGETKKSGIDKPHSPFLNTIPTRTTVKTTYLGDLRTENIHLQSGTKIITDAPCDNRGQGEAFSPTDLLATALGNCIMTIMGIKAMDNGIDLAGTEIEITKIMADAPRHVSEVIMEFNFPKKAYSDDEKQLIESVAGISPVPLSVHPDLKQTIRFNW